MSADPSQAPQITLWLTEWRAGDPQAAERLFVAVYPELRRIAGRFLRNERPDQTLEPAALVHELYFRVFGAMPIDFKDSAHFLAIEHRRCGAFWMRRILIDHARARVQTSGVESSSA